ncbi:MAG: ABC transporter ATP-binding protein [Anaerolineaceae bacterium]|nr:MAG: ABC transporter ATP-binding protein [Anaerolineaceae bacterium]
MQTFDVWKRMISYLKPYKLWAFLAFFGVVGSNILAISIPAILRDVIDIGIIGVMPLLGVMPPLFADMIETFGFEYGNANYMLMAGLLVVGLGVLRGLTGFIFRYFGEILSHYIAYDIRNDVYDKVQRQSFTYHDESQTGTLITRAISDVDEIQRFFAFGLIDGLNTALLFIGVTLMMFGTSPTLAVIALLPIIPLAVLSRNFAMMVSPLWKKIMERLQKLGNHLQENALGAEVVRAFNREDYEVQRFAKDNDRMYHERMDLIRQWATYLPMSALIIAFSTALVLFFGGWMERAGVGGVTVGLIVAFNAYVLLLAQPIRFLGFVILLMTQAISSARRVFEIIDAPERVVNKPEAVTLESVRGLVAFENVAFQYSNTAEDVLEDINFTAKPGEVVAILGPTGSGKSSLVNLIPRFYDVSAGRVTVDGVDVRDVTLESLRRNVGMVLQTSLLFSASIHENILYGRPEASEAEVIAAAKAANAHPFIMEFPDGYDTLVGERGVTLSGGQKQRLAIARALLVNPSILILDDSTSSVDTKTEHQIQQALDILMEGRTTLIIAQRLTSVQNADQILVLRDGRIVERGKHEDLIAQGGYYAEVYEMQMEDQDRVRRELRAVGQLPDSFMDDKLDFDVNELRIIMGQTGD